MKKTGIIISIFLFSFIVASYMPKSAGGHPSSTGAPLESSCSQSTCHQDAPILDGTSAITLDFNQDGLSYYLNQELTLDLSISVSAIQRFGFQIVAIDDYTLSNQGVWVITDNIRTWSHAGLGAVSSRQYVTHTVDGTWPTTQGMNTWSFNWIAPDTSIGPVSFYIACLASNNDGKKLGDTIYQKNYTLQPGTNGLTEKSEEYSIETELNGGLLYIKAYLPSQDKYLLQLISINGQLLKEQDFNPKNGHSLQIKVPEEQGLYVLSFSGNGRKYSKKLWL